MTQEQKIISHLEKWGSITALEAMNCYGIMRLASRISELKRAGHHITSTMDHVKNRYGETVKVARYRLEG